MYSFTATCVDNWSDVYIQGKNLASIAGEYLNHLKEIAIVNDPRGIVFHDFESATKVFSDHPLPAWTNGELIHIDPLVMDWKNIFLSAVSDNISNDIRSEVLNYYSTLDITDVATIIGHEITHHLEYFRQTFDHEINDAMWFEEGMCFYLPRKKLLSKERFEALMRVESLLIKSHKNRFGNHPVWRFGESDDGSGFVAALFDYWRATSVVRTIVEDYASGDVLRVLQLFQDWVQHASNELRFFDYVAKKLHVTDRETLEFL